MLVVLVTAGLMGQVTPGVAEAAAPPPDGQPEPGAVADTDDVASAERVLIVSLPTLRWSDVLDARPPVLLDLVAQSSVASMSPRTVGAVADLGRAYATIGAGNRATTRLGTAGLVYPPATTYEGGEAGEVFERRCGCPVEGAAAVHLGVAQMRAANDRLLFGAVPGSLGGALADAGRTAAVVANADHALAASSEAVHREAAMAVMDTDGRVARGVVGPQLLVDDPDVPFGVRTDVDAAASAFAAVWDEADVVLLEASDLQRVEDYAEVATPDAQVQARRDAIARADELLAAVLDEVDLRRDLVIVLGPNDPRAAPAELTMAAVAGPGFGPGLASSGTTRRDGYLTLPDIAPTILGALDVPLPSAMTGAPMASVPGVAPDLATIEELADDNDIAVFRNRVADPVTVAFVVFQVLTYALAAFALANRSNRLRRATILMALTTMAAPSVAFLSGLVPYEVLGVGGYFVAFFAASAVLAAVVWVVGRALGDRLDPERQLAPVVAPLLLAGLILTILLVDIVLGGRLQIDTVFGYGGGPIVAGRFAGYGNLAFGLVAISAIVVSTGVWGIAHLRRPGRHPRRDRALLGGIAVLFTVCVLAIGLPQLGLNVGGTLSSVPAFLLTGLLLTGAALSVRRVALVGLATLVVIGAFGALDLTRPEESRTHLGRFLTLTGDQGADGFLTVIQRKLASNLNILTSSVWTLVIPVAIAFLAFLAWRQPRFLRRLQVWMPGARACIVGGLVVAVLGGVLNDSGVAIPAMMFAVLLPYLTVLTVRTADP